MQLPSFITPEDKAHHHATFGDDYSHCLNWYHRGINNLGVAEEQALLNSGKIKSKLAKDTLFVPGLKDGISPAVKGKAVMQMAVEEGKLKTVEVNAGHWIMLEKADELCYIVDDFIMSDSSSRTQESV
jgi:soluble epoxide hydrolase / lipid-phosphate phosphatase